MLTEVENCNVKQRNPVNGFNLKDDSLKTGQDCRSNFEFSKMNGQNSKRPLSDFNNRINAERMNGNGGGLHARNNGPRKPKQYNNRVYKPVPKENKPKDNESPFVIHINSNDTELCKANLARLYHMHQSTMQNMQLQRHLAMIAEGTDYLLSQQQANVIQFHEDRKYQENVMSSNRKVD